jgi:predicted deacylase
MQRVTIAPSVRRRCLSSAVVFLLGASSALAQRLPPDPNLPPPARSIIPETGSADELAPSGNPDVVVGPSVPSGMRAKDEAASLSAADSDGHVEQDSAAASGSGVEPADAQEIEPTPATTQTDPARIDPGPVADEPSPAASAAPPPDAASNVKVPFESAVLGRSASGPTEAVDAPESPAGPSERETETATELGSPASSAVQIDEHDAPDLLETPAESPSAFWLDGTRREGSNDDAPAEDPDALVGMPDDPSAYGPPAPDPDANEFGVSPMKVLDHVVAPASRERLTWTTGQSFSGSVMETPVIVVHGIRPGPRLCLTAGVHGDELNGVEVVRRLAYKIEPQELAGTVIAVPIVNLLGFSRGTRYLPDRRDLNRFFPGSANGSSASRIAHSFFSAIIDHCDALVDFHTGSLDRANLPQVRGDLTIPSVVEFTRGFGATAVLHSPGALGMLRFAASNYGVPSVTFEIGGPMRLQPEEIEHGEQAIETLMHKMGMVERRRRWAEPQAVFYESTWVRVDQGGMLFSEVALGDRVASGQRLGRVIDPVSNRSGEILAPEDGRVIGMALNQLVLPGFAAYHLGVAASEERVVNEAEQRSEPGDERFLEYDQLDEDAGPDTELPAEGDEPPVSEPSRSDVPEQD